MRLILSRYVLDSSAITGPRMKPASALRSPSGFTPGYTRGCHWCNTVDMRTPRTLVPIPTGVAAAIDKIAGAGLRTQFIVDVLEGEIRRREQLAALREAAGSWTDEDHPELASGAEAWVKQMRLESEARLKRRDDLETE